MHPWNNLPEDRIIVSKAWTLPRECVFSTSLFPSICLLVCFPIDARSYGNGKVDQSKIPRPQGLISNHFHCLEWRPTMCEMRGMRPHCVWDERHKTPLCVRWEAWGPTMYEMRSMRSHYVWGEKHEAPLCVRWEAWHVCKGKRRYHTWPCSLACAMKGCSPLRG